MSEATAASVAVAVATAHAPAAAAATAAAPNAQPAGAAAAARMGPDAAMQHGKMALILWCRAMAADRPGVDVVDFGDSWQDGLAFCAILARFLGPDVVDFRKLSKSTRSDNLMLAFGSAERAGVPRLLAIEDMADKRNIFTWITHLYHALAPALQGTLLVQRGSAKGSPIWRLETVRLVQNRFALSLAVSRSGSGDEPAAEGSAQDAAGSEDVQELIVPDELQWFSLAMARVAMLPFSEVHKELRTSELERRSVPVLAIYLGASLLLLTSDNAHDVNAWFSFLTQQILGSVVLGVPPSSILQLSTYDGWLLKKGDRGPNRSWKRRFFVLRDNRLRYAKKPFTWTAESGSLTPQAQKMTYSLRLSTGVNPLPSLHPFCFSVDLPCRSLILRLVPTREKEGIVRVESLAVASGFYYASARQGILFLSDKERPNVQRTKIPLYESESEVCDLAGVTQQSVRLLVGGREARTSRVYYISGASLEDTLDWFDVINQQRQLMASFVNAAAWPAPPEEEEEDVEDDEGEAREDVPTAAAQVAASPPASNSPQQS